ncbi:hypothetical protein BPAE_0124g00220 [Botrytis paeoniae]|uniref:Uncharacterized protein n=1 Tax=Botrytis paeoniae TaxID=278948 RepID=A0A4Z1FJJ2_9HELO|nr:hypothetical protein BPAE_0124g00220 [Botrytis paeoniae]
MLRERKGFLNDGFYCNSRFIWPEVTQEWVGATALHIAVYNGHRNLCKFLLSAGADGSAGDHCTGNYTWKKPLETLHILVEGGAEEEFLGNSHFLEKTNMPEDIFSYIQCPTFLNELLFAEKCSIAARITTPTSASGHCLAGQNSHFTSGCTIMKKH